MIAFLNIICIVLLFSGFRVNKYKKKPRTRDMLQQTIKEAKSANLKAIICTLLAFVIEVLVLVDDKLFEKLWFENSYKSYMDRQENILSPIFHIDFLEDWIVFSLTYVWILVVISGIFLLYLLISRVSISSLVNEELNKQEQREAEQIAIVKAMEEKNIQEKVAISSLLSHYDKVIPIDDNESIGYKGWANAFYVSIAEQKIIAARRLINFHDIINCTFIDNSHVTSTQIGTANSQTESDTGSVVGRAVIGGLIAGGTGAVIGGTTAKTHAETNIETTTTSRTIHDYTIVINIKDILSPVCKIHCAENEKAMNEIMGTIKAIINNR